MTAGLFKIEVNSDYKYCNVVKNCDEREGHPRYKRGREEGESL